MGREIRIEARTADDAHALLLELPGYRGVVCAGERGWEVRVELDRGLDETLRDVLGALDGWLAARGLDACAVILANGKRYVVPAPRERPPEGIASAVC